MNLDNVIKKDQPPDIKDVTLISELNFKILMMIKFNTILKSSIKTFLMISNRSHRTKNVNELTFK